MKRRAFLKISPLLGVSGLPVLGCSSKSTTVSELRFDVHPFILAHPEAVFIHRTAATSTTDAGEMRRAGQKLASELIVRTFGFGFPLTSRVVIKPNWTCSGPKNSKPVTERLGVNTDPNFIEGWVRGMKTAGPRDFSIRECACPENWPGMGWSALCERNNIDLRNLSSQHFWDMKAGRDYWLREVPDGVVFKEIAYMAPLTEPGSCLINIAKLKAHGMGITASVKNLQGVACRRFHQFCTPLSKIRKEYEPQYLKYFQPEFEKRVEELYARHVRDGIPRWDRPGEDLGGLRQELWAQRTLDSVDCLPSALSMVEGIYSQDGNGFGAGPHEPLGQEGVTSRDYLSNVVLFGKDMFRVDMLAFWLAGHEPGNFGLFHIARERGRSDVLDPREIPLYEWKDGRATPVKIDSLTRIPLVTPYLRRDYNGGSEPEYHLCNEPFNYSAFRSVKRESALPPSLRHLGSDGEGRAVFDLSLPESGDVSVDILDPRGNVVDRILTGNLETGSHQALWSALARPGAYTARAYGRGWETTERMMIRG